MQHKFTADGKKVAVIGALNAKETIVQEVFVADGTEFPAGEHFVVKTLLDAPAETYRMRAEKELESRIKGLKATIESLSVRIEKLNVTSQAAFAKVKWIEGIKEDEVQRVFDHVKAVILGEYTHVVVAPEFGSPTIEAWEPDTFIDADRHGRFDGLRLVSLYGEWRGRLALDWRVNTYRDGSGSNTRIIPCKSYDQAVSTVKGLIDEKPRLSDADYALCVNLGIEVDEAKNGARLQAKREYVQRQIDETKARLAKQEAELAALGG